jgi:hypothetical protein
VAKHYVWLRFGQKRRAGEALMRNEIMTTLILGAEALKWSVHLPDIPQNRLVWLGIYRMFASKALLFFIISERRRLGSVV